jgi:hypothetical protein
MKEEVIRFIRISSHEIYGKFMRFDLSHWLFCIIIIVDGLLFI